MGGVAERWREEACDRKIKSKKSEEVQTRKSMLQNERIIQVDPLGLRSISADWYKKGKCGSAQNNEGCEHPAKPGESNIGLFFNNITIHFESTQYVLPVKDDWRICNHDGLWPQKDMVMDKKIRTFPLGHTPTNGGKNSSMYFQSLKY